MKKSLIALAALAAVGAASAQSSVTLYGLVDIGFGAQVTEQRAGPLGTVSQRSSGVMDGANAGNRIGFRGTEDLGGGLKANFVVEQGISPTSSNLFTQRAASAGQQVAAYPAAFSANSALNGASSFSASTNRQSYVGLESADMGRLNIGYTYNNLYEMSTLSGYALGSEGLPGAALSHVFGNNYLGGTRSNGFTYISPVIAGGFTVRAQYGAAGATMMTNNNVTAANVTVPNEGKRFSLMGQYINGPLSAALAYTNNNVKSAAATGTGSIARTGNLTQLGASYDFGVAKVGGTFNSGRDGGILATNFGLAAASGISTAFRSYQVGVSAPFGALVPFITYGRAYTTTDGIAARTIDAKQIQVGARYSLSKRTTAYVFYGTATDDAAQSTAIGLAAAATSTYKDKKTVLGVAHSF